MIASGILLIRIPIRYAKPVKVQYQFKVIIIIIIIIWIIIIINELLTEIHSI